jgi:hypothetical protein
LTDTGRARIKLRSATAALLISYGINHHSLRGRFLPLIPVLESAGFRVNVRSSIELLIEELQRQDAAAVAVPEQLGLKVENLITEVRSRSSAPVILFESGLGQQLEAEFDLVIPVLTSPERWLQDIAGLINRSRTVLREAQELHAQSSALRNESRAVRRRAREEAERPRELSRVFDGRNGFGSPKRR